MVSPKRSTSSGELTIFEAGRQDAQSSRDSSLLAAFSASPSYYFPADIDPGVIANATPTWTTRSTAFAPMKMIRQTSSLAIANGKTSGSLHVLSGNEIATRQLASFSPSYAGDTNCWRNQNLPVPDDMNTAIWITRLPQGVTYKELLGAVRNMGRIWSSHINRPEPHKGIYTAAAKLVFFEAVAAQRFLAYCHGPGLIIRRNRATACHNRNRKSEEQTNPHVDTQHSLPPSRILVIAGPPFFVHPPALLNYFAARFYFDVEVIVPVVQGHTFSIYEWRFSSFSCQAEAAFMAINRDRFLGDAGVTVAYGIDPCDCFGRV